MKQLLALSAVSLTLLTAVFGPTSVARAQEKKTADPFDLSALEKLTRELGVPTIHEVATLEAKAKALLDADNCTSAIPVLDEYARKANWLANLIATGIQPYYGASYDEKKHFSDVQPLIPFERQSNDYKSKRNHAMVMQGECFAKLGNKSKAAAMLVQALSLINLQDREWWQRARTSLYGLIGVER